MSEFKDLVRVVYLSGPMDNLSTETEDPALSMSIWREKAERYFSDHDIKVINPIRVPKGINARFIVRGDKMSIQKSDALLVNLTQVCTPGVEGKIIMGAGTIQEILYGYELGKPVVIYDEHRGYDDISVWIRYHSTLICSTQKEAVQWLVSLNDKKLRKIEYRQDDTTIEGFGKK